MASAIMALRATCQKHSLLLDASAASIIIFQLQRRNVLLVPRENRPVFLESPRPGCRRGRNLHARRGTANRVRLLPGVPDHVRTKVCASQTSPGESVVHVLPGIRN